MTKSTENRIYKRQKRKIDRESHLNNAKSRNRQNRIKTKQREKSTEKSQNREINGNKIERI